MARLPRVLLLAPHWPPDAGAAAARLSGLSLGLETLGHELRVVAPSASYLSPAEAGAGRDPSIETVTVAARGQGSAANAWHQLRLWLALRGAARRVLSDFSADVVLVSSPPLAAALAGTGLRDRSGRLLPLVVDLRDLWPDVAVEAGAFSAASPQAVALRFLETRLLGAATVLTTVTESKCERLRARSNRRVVLVPNGVDPSWVADPPPREPAREPFELLYAGNLGRAQDVAALVRAVAGLSGACATIVGDGQERGAVAACIDELDAPATLHAPEPRVRVRERLGSCGAAFVTLRTAALVDAVPSKLLEAMALGVPVLASAAGEAARLLEESGGGVVVRPGDDEALRQAVSRLRELSEDELRVMGERGREFVLSRYRREEAAARLSRVLQEAAA